MVTEALQSVFDLAGTTHDPVCAPNVTVDDSNPLHHTIGYCATLAPALPLGNVILRVSNERDYPVDLSYPATLGSQCGEYGKCLRIRAANDVWLQIGSLLSPGHHKVLLPGGGQAAAVSLIAAGKTATFATSLDHPAMFFGFLEAGIKVFAAIMTRGTNLKSAEFFDAVIKASDGLACIRDGWQAGQGPLRIATAAFSCVGAMLPDVLKRLGRDKLEIFADAFQTATGFVGASLGSISGNLDNITGASNHALTIHGMAPTLGPTRCGVVNDGLVGRAVAVKVTKGAVSCQTAMAIVNTYYNHPPEPPSGSGGFVKIGVWECYSTSGAVYQQTGHEGDCDGAQGEHISIDRP